MFHLSSLRWKHKTIQAAQRHLGVSFTLERTFDAFDTGEETMTNCLWQAKQLNCMAPFWLCPTKICSFRRRLWKPHPVPCNNSALPLKLFFFSWWCHLFVLYASSTIVQLSYNDNTLLTGPWGSRKSCRWRSKRRHVKVNRSVSQWSENVVCWHERHQRKERGRKGSLAWHTCKVLLTLTSLKEVPGILFSTGSRCSSPPTDGLHLHATAHTRSIYTLQPPNRCHVSILPHGAKRFCAACQAPASHKLLLHSARPATQQNLVLLPTIMDDSTARFWKWIKPFLLHCPVLCLPSISHRYCHTWTKTPTWWGLPWEGRCMERSSRGASGTFQGKKSQVVHQCDVLPLESREAQ